MISERLTNKTVKEKAQIKSEEISKVDFKGKTLEPKYGIEIEIQSVNEIDGGVEIFARARKDGKPLGFGTDGSVEIERFRIFNPPILVPDTGGDITSTGKNIDGSTTPIKYREDAKQAILESLVHTIQVTGKDGGNIVKGKVGNTTSTFYPSYDGWFFNANATSWAASRSDATSDDFGAAEANNTIVAQSSNWTIMRHMWTLDTSAIPDADVISSATFSLASYQGSAASPDNSDIDIVAGTPADEASYSTADYDQVGSTVFGSKAFLDFKDLVDGTYVDFTLNASGIANIDKTGNSVFAGRSSNDTDNSAPTDNNNVNIYMNNYAGTTRDPKLVVEHAEAASGPANLKTLNGLAKASIKTINGLAIASVKTVNGLS
jgi:hypothetical protein